MAALADRLHVALITRGYPSIALPGTATFVQAAARGLARTGARVSVIVPNPVGRRPPQREPGAEDEDAAIGLTVAYPWHFSFSRRRLPGGLSTFGLTLWGFSGAVRRAVLAMPERPSVLYGHFLYSSGYAAARVGQELGIPSVVAVGESTMAGYERDLGIDHVRRTLSQLDGVLSVSEENRAYCVDVLGADPERITVIPNAVDREKFRPRDRAEMRRKHDLPPDAKIVAFVGHFIERKGPHRVLEALSRVPDARGVFLGGGGAAPRGPQVLHAGRVPHHEVPEWLCAADLFVFPTRAEGSPNAILEAMACGLPVVSSDIPAVREVVGPEQGLLVDPDDVAGIAGAVERILGDDSLRARMSASAIERARRNSLEARVMRIRSWLEATIARS